MSLYHKYRPSELDQIVGNGDVVASLKADLEKKDPPHAFLFHGPTGCGKTTLGRIMGKALGAKDTNLREIDVADFRGIDSIRDIRKQMGFKPLGKGSSSRVWILDECFHGDMEVECERGSIPIKDVRVGDKVKNLKGWGIVEKKFKNKVPLDRIVCVRAEGKNIICSEDHEFFTSEGWVKAKNLTALHYILSSDNMLMTSLASKEGSEYEALRMVQERGASQWEQILLVHLLSTVQGSKSRSNKKFGRLYLYGLRKRNEIEACSRKIKEILFPAVPLQKLHLCTASCFSGNQEEDFGWVEKIQSYQERQKTCKKSFQTIEENEQVTNDAYLQRKSQAEKDNERNLSQMDGYSGRQRTLHSSSNKGVDVLTITRMGIGICHTLRNMLERGISELLQSGYSLSKIKTGHRSGWPFSQRKERKASGQEEGNYAGFTRVESVESYQQTSGQEVWKGVIKDSEIYRNFVEFFDLQISNHHSYFVEGVAVHNCHSLVTLAQNALLKALEDTPDHVFFILCTTDPQKLIPTIRGRCSQYQVKKLDQDEMKTLLKSVVKGESEKLSKEVMEQIVIDSDGHPRNALQILDQVLGVDKEQRLEIAKQVAEQQNESIELCRALMAKSSSWKSVAKILSGLRKQDPEAVRRTALGYSTSVLLKGSNDRAAAIMEAMESPFYDSGFPGLVLACYSIYSD